MKTPREQTDRGYPRRDPKFYGRCYLCGAPISRRALYCIAHRWAGE